MSREILLELLGDRPVAYHPTLAKVLGSVKAALFLSQLLYWSKRGKDPDGWIYKTRQEIHEETGLSRAEQEGARKVLRDGGVLEETRRGVPATMHFRVDQDRLIDVLQLAGNRPSQLAENQPTGWRETRTQDGGEPADQSAENLRSIPESTSETTQKPLATGDRRPRPRDELFESIVEAWGWNLEDLTDDARGQANRTARQLRKLRATPEQVLLFPRWWRAAHEVDVGSPTTATKHWPAFMAWFRRRGAGSTPPSPADPPLTPEELEASEQARQEALGRWRGGRRPPQLAEASGG